MADIDVKITVDVEYYQLSQANARDDNLFQSPISLERPRDVAKILVRNDRGAAKNEVSVKKQDELVKLDIPLGKTYAHGIILRAQPEEGSHRGDLVWLAESPARELDKSVKDSTHIVVNNLRTWKALSIALDDVCWIPKYSRLSPGEGGGSYEELLTISGKPVMKHDKKTYIMAVVQPCHLRGNTVEVGRASVREIVEHETWKYQFLTRDGEERVERLVRRNLAQVVDNREEHAVQPDDMALLALQTGPDSEQASSSASSTVGDIAENASISIDIYRALIEPEPDESIAQGTLALERMVLSKHSRKKEPLLPPRPVSTLR